LRRSSISEHPARCRTLAIASGNTLRRDDGVAHYVLDLLDGVDKRAVLQLSPEMAQEIGASTW
jgi:hypothetical protein